MYELVKVEAERHHRRDVKVLEVPKDSAPTSPPRDEANDPRMTRGRHMQLRTRCHLHQPDLILGLAPARFHLGGAL